MPYRYLFSLLPLLVGLSLNGASQSVEGGQPVVGEKAIYELRWSYFAVGSVEIRLDPSEENEEMLRATLEAKANAFMRRVHDFHTVIASDFPASVEKSHGYSRDELANENLHETQFEWEEGTVRYVRNQDVRAPLQLQPLTHDPLSIVFAFRSGAMPLKPGTYLAWVTDGEVIDQAEFKVKGPEKIKTPAGKFETYRVTADFKGVRAIFARPEGALIDVWITNDDRMIPVKLKSEATIGSFRSELEEYIPAGEAGSQTK
mgnify:CR=1 FL=1